MVDAGALRVAFKRAMYSYTRYTASRDVFVDETYHCPSCGLTMECRAFAKGKGYARSSGWTHTPSAARRAADDALRSAYTSARLMVRLAPCPRCGRRSADALSWRTRAIVTLAVLLAISVGTAVVAFVAHGMLGLGAGVLTGFILLVTAYAAAGAASDWYGAARRVHLARADAASIEGYRSVAWSSTIESRQR